MLHASNCFTPYRWIKENVVSAIHEKIKTLKLLKLIESFRKIELLKAGWKSTEVYLKSSVSIVQIFFFPKELFKLCNTVT
jgi:hypothetical protein